MPPPRSQPRSPSLLLFPAESPRDRERISRCQQVFLRIPAPSFTPPAEACLLLVIPACPPSSPLPSPCCSSQRSLCTSGHVPRSASKRFWSQRLAHWSEA